MSLLLPTLAPAWEQEVLGISWRIHPLELNTLQTQDADKFTGWGLVFVQILGKSNACIAGVLF